MNLTPTMRRILIDTLDTPYYALLAVNPRTVAALDIRGLVRYTRDETPVLNSDGIRAAAALWEKHLAKTNAQTVRMILDGDDAGLQKAADAVIAANAAPKRQFCRTGIHSAVPAVTLTFNNGATSLCWCAEHAADAEAYRPTSDQASDADKAQRAAEMRAAIADYYAR